METLKQLQIPLVFPTLNKFIYTILHLLTIQYWIKDVYI